MPASKAEAGPKTATKEARRLPTKALALAALVKKPHPTRTDYKHPTRPGVYLTLGPSKATWYYLRRIDGKLTRLKLGELGTMTMPQAELKAAEHDANVERGVHPKAEQARERAAKAEARDIDRSRILASAADAWATKHLPTIAPSTAADYQRALDMIVERFGDRDIASMTRGELKRFLDGIKAPSTANRCAVVLRLVFAYAEDRFDLPNNPASTIKNPAKQTIRTRTLDRNEIRIVWRAAELAGYPWGHALRFALCTGQRIGEVGGILRGEVDDAGFWTQTRNKSDRRIDLRIAGLAGDILATCPDYGRGAPYFSASTAADGSPRPLRTDAWTHALDRHIAPRLADAAEQLRLPPIAKPWTCHDLRRTVRTGLTGWCRVLPDTAERVLNHTLGGLRAVYDFADYRHHVADALEEWDAELGRILRGLEPGYGKARA